MFHVQCPQCGQWAVTSDGANPGAALVCACCPHPHDHDESANSCDQAHDGDCSVPEPTCGVCRPVIITLLPGTMTLTAAV